MIAVILNESNCISFPVFNVEVPGGDKQAVLTLSECYQTDESLYI